MSLRERLAMACGAAALLGACGGNVDLGERTPSAALPPDDGSNDEPNDPHHVPSTRLLPVQPGESMDTLAVFGDFLYLGLSPNNGQAGLYRCNKSDCERSLKKLPHVTDGLYTLKVSEQRLVVTGGNEGLWIGSFALPEVTDKQVVIDELPLLDVTEPLFHHGYAYWPLTLDRSLYRCVLPDCAGGPTPIGEGLLSGNAEADGELLFALDTSGIVRIGGLGDGALERLQPDATLSPAPAESDRSEPPVYATQIRTAAGKLYATLQPSSCNGCATTFVRWPVAGGAREDLFETPDVVGSFFVLGSELVWLARHPDDLDRATLSTCRIEACSTTLRHLGQVRAELRGIAADDQRLYWLQTARIDPANFSEVAVRSVSLLPTP